MNGIADNRDWRVMGSNPCVTGDTLVFTIRGPRRIDLLLGKPFSVLVDGKVHRCETGAFQTGVKPVYLLQTEEGHSIRVTDDHQIRMSPKITAKKRYEIWVPAGDLVPGDQIVLNNVRVCGGSSGDYAPLCWSGAGTEGQGWLLGSLLGDGHIRSGDIAVLQFWGSTKKTMLGTALKRIEVLGGDPRYHKQRMGTEVPDRDMVSTQSVQLLRVAREFGISDNKDIVSDVVLMASSVFQRGLLRGLLDADGSVQGNQEKGVSVRLSSSRPQYLIVAQRMLLHFGINSTIYWNRREAGETLLPEGKGGAAFYHTKAQHELVISKDNLQVFAERVGFEDPLKTEQLQTVLDGYFRAPNRDRFVATVKSLTYIGIEPVFDCTIEEAHCFGANGIIVHNCGEQMLESWEACVTGDTILHLQDGVGPIQDFVGKTVQVWNGDRWSAVKPRNTGEGREIFRVTLSDGSFVDCTSNHGWHVLPEGKRVFRRVKTSDLCLGSQVVPFEISAPLKGEFNPVAFETGMFVGDGYLNRNGDYTYPMVVICGGKANLQDLDVRGVWRKPQKLERYAEPVNRLSLHKLLSVEEAKNLNNRTLGLTKAIFRMDRDSILEFVAGWVETDGTITNKGTPAEGYRVYGAELKIRDLQTLLRRVGINHSTVRLLAEAGVETNFGIRNYALWYCQIPSFECGSIPTRLKMLSNIGSRTARNNAHPDGGFIDRARKQKVVEVERLPGKHTTYCFDEPENHMAVFGNVLTYQCNLVETFPAHHEDYDDFQRTLKMAYLYAKTVTLIPTHNPRANAVMTRNRRIGCSMSGIVQAMVKHGRRGFLIWCDRGYEYIQRLDRVYSDWLGVPLSRRTTTVKPSGTTSLLPGATPGIHYPHSEFYIRRIRVANTSPLVLAAVRAGHQVEPDTYADDTSVISFPVRERLFVKGKSEVTIWEQFLNTADMQRHWSDNAVSVTVNFKSDEVRDIKLCLEAFEDRLKGVSLWPDKDHGYKQPPYEAITKSTHEQMAARISPMCFEESLHEVDDKFCSGDKCQLFR
jgi:ribonucleotide reductase alpha subunit